MPRARRGKPLVESCVALNVVDLVRPDGSPGPKAWGSAELRDPATGRVAGTVSWRPEVYDGWGWVHVAHRRAGQDWDAIAYRIDLEIARSAVGMRWRLWCPLTGRPARALFLPAIESRFGSREANGLAYGSQGLSPSRRAEARARRIRIALGGPPDLAAPFPEWPNRMRVTTYQNRRAEAEAATALALGGRTLPSFRMEKHP